MWLRLLAGWLCVNCVVTAWAQEKKYCLCVGVQEYAHEKLREPAPLKYAVADATALAVVLKQAGYEGVLLTDVTGKNNPDKIPTKANIDRHLRELAKKCRRGDTLLVAFTGHGLQFSREPDAYFCPQDARPFAEKKDTLVSIGKVYEELDASFAAVKIVLVDACRNDPDPSRGRSGLDADAAPAPPRGVAALFSCSAGQKAFEHDELRHGVFFHHVLRGLQGEAVNQRGEVTFTSLFEYVGDAVPKEMRRLIPGREQEPNIKADLKGGSPVLVKLTAPGTPVVPRVRPVAPPPSVSGVGEGKQAGELREDNGLQMKFVWCPAGTFTMGSPAGETGRDTDEDQASVTLSRGFWLGKTEVTQGQWKQVMGTEPWKGETYVQEGADNAATYVNWTDATEFCQKLTQQERSGGRLAADWSYSLPTEAQWEYACRAESKTTYSFGDDMSKLSDYAWWGGILGDGSAKSEQYAHRVGLKKPNAWGLNDMHGNVYEWCRDWYVVKRPGGRDPEVAAQGSASGRVLRGGGWDFYGEDCRSGDRDRTEPGCRDFNFGFRVALVQTSK